MFIDGNEVEGRVFQADLCIIGAGAAGITIAREFLNTGYKVTLLESGDKFQDNEIQTLSGGENTGLPYYDIDSTRNRAFGGTSHLWCVELPDGDEGVRLRGLDSVDFEKRNGLSNSGWPFTKEELNPYYERAHDVFKIGPYTYSPEDWLENSKSEPLTFERNKVETTIFQFARKNIFYDEYFKELDEVENISVLLNSTVLKINTESSNKVDYLSVITKNRKRFDVRAKVYVLAAGGLENARLLLLSNDEVKEGLGNKKDLVGRYFMEHPHQWKNVGTFYPSNPEKFNNSSLYRTHERNGFPVMGYLTLNEEVKNNEQLLNCVIGISGTSEKIFSSKGLDVAKKGLLQLRQIVLRKRAIKNILKDLMLIFSNLNVVVYDVIRRVLRGNRKTWNRYEFRQSGVNVKIMAEQQPNPESRVKLSREKDHLGQRKLELDWRLKNNDLTSIRKTLEIIDEELRREKLGHIEIDFIDAEPSRFLEGGYHHMGTTRMHENEALGVVDPQCKLHGTDNLYVAGSSVFPTSGCANPTLTIVALALRLSDHLKEESRVN